MKQVSGSEQSNKWAAVNNGRGGMLSRRTDICQYLRCLKFTSNYNWYVIFQFLKVNLIWR